MRKKCNFRLSQSEFMCVLLSINLRALNTSLVFIHSFAASRQTLSRFVRRNCFAFGHCFQGSSLRNLSAVQFVHWLTSGTVLSILCGDSDKLWTTQTMPPRTRPSKSTSRQSLQPNIDPTPFWALSLDQMRTIQQLIKNTVQ